MASSCPKCHQIIEDDSVCCAEVKYTWKCRACGKLSNGFVVPYGRCFLCGANHPIASSIRSYCTSCRHSREWYAESDLADPRHQRVRDRVAQVWSVDQRIDRYREFKDRTPNRTQDVASGPERQRHHVQVLPRPGLGRSYFCAAAYGQQPPGRQRQRSTQRMESEASEIRLLCGAAERRTYRVLSPYDRRALPELRRRAAVGDADDGYSGESAGQY